MPWTAKDAEGHTKKADTPKKQKTWAKIANKALAACLKKGRSQESCEASAIKQANAVIGKMGEAGTTKGYNAFMVRVGKERKSISELIDSYQRPEAEETESEPVDEYEVLAGPEGERRYLPVYGSVTTFADLHTAHDAVRTSWEVEELTEQYKRLIENVMFNAEVTDKPATLRALSDEFIALIEERIEAPPAEAITLEGVEFLEADPVEVRFAESDGLGSIIGIQEAGNVATGGEEPLIMNVAVVEPGWGCQNKAGDDESRYYYTAEVLARDIGVFKGAKMHETDHAERSNKSWASTVMDFVGFTETGGPIAKVGVHDPDFARRAIQLDKLGLLDKLVPSILGEGISRKGKAPDGKKGLIVEAITKGYFVDWVSRTAAGGRTVALGESEEVVSMGEEKKPEGTEEIVKEGEPVKVVIKESDPPAEKPLDKAEALKIIEDATLPELATKRLAEAEYADEDELKGAISEWQADINALVGAGKPVGNAVGSVPADKSEEERMAEADKLKSGVNAEWFGAPAPVKREA